MLLLYPKVAGGGRVRLILLLSFLLFISCDNSSDFELQPAWDTDTESSEQTQIAFAIPIFGSVGLI